MKHLDILGNTGAVFFTALQIDTVGIQDAISIICLVLTCVSVLLSIVSKVINWYNKSKQDGHISQEEIKEIAEEIRDEINNAKGEINGRK